MKNFRLPKEFGIKWLEALRSGKYKQTNGTLCNIDENEKNTNNVGYCCLGIGATINGVPDTLLVGWEVLVPEIFGRFIPSEILRSSSENEFVQLVAPLNDGCSKMTFKSYLDKGIIFRPEIMEKYEATQVYFEYLTFAQIADVIEDNTVFYE